jgi:hypothetical protein
MCIERIELFVRIFLIYSHLKFHFPWKDILHQPVNTTLPLTFPKEIISCIWPKILITDSPVDHKEYLNDVALCTVRYSWCLSTAGTTLLFTQSVNSTNITLHILQCVTVRWRFLLRDCLTNRNVSSSSPYRIFHWLHPSGRTVPLRSTQPLTEMTDRVVFWE